MHVPYATPDKFGRRSQPGDYDFVRFIEIKIELLLCLDEFQRYPVAAQLYEHIEVQCR